MTWSQHILQRIVRTNYIWYCSFTYFYITSCLKWRLFHKEILLKMSIIFKRTFKQSFICSAAIADMDFNLFITNVYYIFPPYFLFSNTTCICLKMKCQKLPTYLLDGICNYSTSFQCSDVLRYIWLIIRGIQVLLSWISNIFNSSSPNWRSRLGHIQQSILDFRFLRVLLSKCWLMDTKKKSVCLI